MENAAKRINGWTLLPFLLFMILYLVGFPAVTSAVISVATGFFFGRDKVSKKFSTFAKGAGAESVLIMIVIYAMAGAFSAICTTMGGRDAVVNFGLSLVPPRFLIAGCFVIAVVMSTACGTSMGTIAAITPIAVGVAEKANLDMLMLLGAVVGGAMFGDNLSMISDTTIAATRGQGVEMRDKFRNNFLIALPAAILTFILLCIFGRPETVVPLEGLEYSLIKILPYFAVLIMALCGMDVIVVLGVGIASALVIGLLTASITISEFAVAVRDGIYDMDQSIYLALLIGGLAEICRKEGGIEWLVVHMRRLMKSKKTAQLGIGALVGLVDAATTNNTVSIIVSNPIAKEVSTEYKIDPRRTASLLDLFSCVIQGIIPHGGQTLLACTLAATLGSTATPITVIPYLWYCFFLGIFGIISIFVPYADGVCRKDPWNWEYECPESKVEAKKAELSAD